MTLNTIPVSISRADRRDYLRSLIGKPYAAGADGPSAFDCYGLTREVLKTLHGVLLPSSRIEMPSRRAWRRVSLPEDGAIVLMGVRDKHIGIFEARGVLHAMEGFGVLFDPLIDLKYRGFGRLRMFVYDASDKR